LTLIESGKLPGSADRAWELLAKRQGALRLTPGLAAGPEGRGTFRVVLGGHSLTYRGYARQHVEEEGRHLTWTLSGKEVRGTGRAHAEVRVRLRDDPDGGTDLRLTVLVDGRGRLDEVSQDELDRAVSSLIARFRRAVAAELLTGAPSRAKPLPSAAPKGAGAAERREPEPAPGPPIAGRIEVVPPSPTSRRWSLSAGAAAAAALAVGVGALVFWRSRRRG